MIKLKIECPVCGELVSCIEDKLAVHPRKGPRCEGSRVLCSGAHQINESRSGKRPLSLREEHDGPDSRYLSARLNYDGSLLIEGQDLGRKTALASSDGEYEWAWTILPEHIPQLLALLDAPANAKILEVLAIHWTGEQSHELERLIRDYIPSNIWTWGG